jgi:leucyl aminopeptidase (aminopeptidase T)
MSQSFKDLSMYQSTVLATRGARLVIDLAGISSGNSVLILSDKNRWLEAEAIAGECLVVGAHPLLVDLTYMATWYYANLKRPKMPRHLVSAFNASNFTLAVADNEFCHMLGHLDENRAAQNRGMRWISVEDYMCEWDIDMVEIDKFIERTHLLTQILSKCDRVRIKSKTGTDIHIQRKPGTEAISFIPKGGKMGEIVPNYAESAMVPLEWTTQGRAVIDGIIIGLGEMRDDPVDCAIEAGRIVDVRGSRNAARFSQFLADSGENADAICELGVATSHTEKRAYEYIGRPGHRAYGAWGSIHLGIGNNTAIGGVIRSPIHVDCQIYDTTVEVDGKKVMDEGRYLF